MLNFNISEILVVVVVALIVFGPERLPEIAEKLGKMMRGFNQLKEKMKSEFELSEKHEVLEKNIARAKRAEEMREEDV